MYDHDNTGAALMGVIEHLTNRVVEQAQARTRLEADHNYTVRNLYKTIHELTDQVQDLKHTAGAAAMPPSQVASALQDLMQATKHDQYTTCIKIVRQLTGYGLKEAKDVVDQVRGL